jgi:hypothetical protein
MLFLVNNSANEQKFSNNFNVLLKHINLKMKGEEFFLITLFLDVFSILKKNLNYKVIVIEYEVFPKLNIYSENDELLISVINTFQFIEIFNQESNLFRKKMKYNISKIDKDDNFFLIEKIFILNNKLKFLTFKDNVQFLYPINEFLKDNEKTILYNIYFLNKFPKTKIKLEEFIKNPKEIISLEKIINY